MNTNDPIEDLFRSRNNETVSEKPRDLVWKRIESGLQNNEKKKKPIREFVSSVWFSAAVFALIAIPYFVLFVQNISTENNNNLLEVVKSNTPTLNKSAEEVDVIPKVLPDNNILNKSVEIVKNKATSKEPVYKVIEEKVIVPVAGVDYFPEIAKTSAPIAEPSFAPKAMEIRSQVLDSIEKEEQLASIHLKQSGKDSIANRTNASMAIKGYSKIKDTSEVMKMKVVAAEGKVNNDLETVSVIEVAPKTSVVKESSIIYKPLKFTVKSDILRTNFKLLKRSKNIISFKNSTNSVLITFEKINDKIILTTNQPNIDAVLLGVLEKNKSEIFKNYQLK